MTNSTHPGVGRCKHIIRHDAASLAQPGIDPTQEPAERAGPCLFKTWDSIPVGGGKSSAHHGRGTAALPAGDRQHRLPVSAHRRSVRRTRARAVRGLPITGIALIHHEDGSVHEKARAKLLAGCERNGEMALPFYETDR